MSGAEAHVACSNMQQNMSSCQRQGVVVLLRTIAVACTAQGNGHANLTLATLLMLPLLLAVVTAITSMLVHLSVRQTCQLAFKMAGS
jgi:hypothetical protein